MNFSPAVNEALAMARQLPRARAQGIRPHKRPVGGRPNPCAMHKEASHPLAAMARIGGGRPNRRKQQQREVIEPGWKLVSQAIQSGVIPVGVIITEKIITAAIPYGTTGGMQMLAIKLAENREPVRINEVGMNKWIARLV
jgi:hypothetical protein